MQDQGAYETEKGMEQRREVIRELNVLVQQWVQSISLSKSVPKQLTTGLEPAEKASAISLPVAGVA